MNKKPIPSTYGWHNNHGKKNTNSRSNIINKIDTK